MIAITTSIDERKPLRIRDTSKLDSSAHARRCFRATIFGPVKESVPPPRKIMSRNPRNTFFFATSLAAPAQLLRDCSPAQSSADAWPLSFGAACRLSDSSRARAQ